MQDLTKQLNSLSLNPRRLLIVHSSATLLHTSSKPHPECPARITSIIDQLSKISSSKAKGEKSVIKIKEITQVENPEKVQAMIVEIHGQNYHEFVSEMWQEGMTKKTEMFINMDTYFMKNTYKAALAACNGVIQTVDGIFSQNFDNGFAIVRPPGHHSGMKTQPHGFSFFNNIAIGTNYALQQLPKEKRKIAIIDWDVHHGEGTQKIFYSRSEVLFISIHRFDDGKFFPHIKESGSESVGQGKGQGFNANICWDLPQKAKGQQYSYEDGQTVGDIEYFACFQQIVLPILKQYNPELIFISCGFDSAEGDPIGNLKLSSAGYTFMTQSLMSLGKKMVLVLEGGYNLQSLAWGSDAVVSALIGNVGYDVQKKVQEIRFELKEGNRMVNKIGAAGIDRSLKCIQKYWKSLQ